MSKEGALTTPVLLITAQTYLLPIFQLSFVRECSEDKPPHSPHKNLQNYALKNNTSQSLKMTV